MTNMDRQTEAQTVAQQESERLRIKREVEIALRRTAALRAAVRRIEQHFATQRS